MSSVLVYGVERSGQLSSRKGLKLGGVAFEGQLGFWYFFVSFLSFVLFFRIVDLIFLLGGTCGCRRFLSFMFYGFVVCRDLVFCFSFGFKQFGKFFREFRLVYWFLWINQLWRYEGKVVRKYDRFLGDYMVQQRLEGVCFQS